MEIINLIAAIVAFSGIIVGVLLAHFAKEEIKPGKPYLAMLQKSLYLILAVIMVNFFEIPILFRIVVYVLIMFIVVFVNIKSELLYPAFGILLYLSATNSMTFLLVASLVFLIGFPTGSLAVNPKQKIRKEAFRIALIHSGFIVPLLLFLVKAS